MGTTISPGKLRQKLDKEASDLGFGICRVTNALLPEQVGDHLLEAIDLKYHASMQWLEDTAQRRRNPKAMWNDAQSAIVLGMNYGPQTDPLENLSKSELGTVSVYARNRDYHDIIKGKLKILAGKFVSWTGAEVKVFVDTAPLMEKPLAAGAGIGWQGKHTNLVSRDFGSWLFLGVILTSAKLEPDEPETDHCGNCCACLEVCPTGAFPAPYQLDARRCISYLTIEHDGMIDIGLRKGMGNRIYGCDDCLAVCPWNKFASSSAELKLAAREDLNRPAIMDLLMFDDAEFRSFFSGSPIKRIGRDRFIRNVLIAAGNSDLPELIPAIEPHLGDANPMVRGTAVWAFARLSDDEGFMRKHAETGIGETDSLVLAEWHREIETKADRTAY